MSLSLEPGWYNSLQDIIYKNFKKEDDLREAIEHVFSYVQRSGRCTSKKIFIEEKREKMIAKFCIAYFKDTTPAELCKTKFLRKLAKHNKVDTEYCERIYSRILLRSLDSFPTRAALISYVAAASWRADIEEIILDPPNIFI